MFKAKIYGAGSIGAHYAHALVNNSFEVDVFDISRDALFRFEKKIYPSRYKFFSDKILILEKDIDKKYDLVIIGTPPTSHYKIVKKNIKRDIKIIHIEKPLCSSFNKDIENFKKLKNNNNIFISVGYNHVLTEVCKKSLEILKKNKFGKIQYIESETKEHWDNIFNAHFWLKKVNDSYLGNSKFGGGALHEHSHALHLAHYFLKKINPTDDFEHVYCKMLSKQGRGYLYDSLSKLEVITKKKLLVSVHQDLVSKKASKKLHLEFENGYLSLIINYKKDTDLLEYKVDKKKIKQIKFKKSRPDDFLGTVLNYKKYLNDKIYNNDLNLSGSIKIMETIRASFLSNNKNKIIKI